MGIKDWVKLFPQQKLLKEIELKGKTIAVDANWEIHRLTQGIKKILTDSKGNPTNHVKGVFQTVLKHIREGRKTIWVFDSAFGNPDKEFTNKKRKQIKENAKKDLEKLEFIQKKKQAMTKEIENDMIFSDDEDEKNEKDEKSEIGEIGEKNYNANTETFANTKIIKTESNKEKKVCENIVDIDDDNNKTELEDKINKKKRDMFSINSTVIEEVQFILNTFGIPHITAEKGIEAECLASYMEMTGMVDYVLSRDSDAMVFGAKNLISYDSKNKGFRFWNADVIKEQYKLTENDFRKLAVILGGDFAEKNPMFKGIGPATVIKKLKSGELDERLEKKEIVEIINKYNKKEILDKLDIKSCIHTEKVTQEGLDSLEHWLVHERDFNKTKTVKPAITKVIHYLDIKKSQE